jgi:hypothetical protein
VLIAIAGAAAGAYGYTAFADAEPPGRVGPQVGDTGIASPRAPVLAAVAIAPQPKGAAKDEPAPGTITASASAAPPPSPPVEVVLPPPSPPPPFDAAALQPEIALTWSEVLEVQKRLASLGLNPGPLDGVVGPRTVGSVQHYEGLHALPLTGKVDRRLLQALQREDEATTAVAAKVP